MKHNATPALTTLLCLSFTFSFSQSQSPSIRFVWERTASVRTIEFSSDATRVITGGATGDCYPYECGQIKVWNAANGTLINTIVPYNIGLTNDVDISSNGQTIISGNGSVYCPESGCFIDKPGQFKFSIIGTLQKSVSDPGGNVYAIKYSPDESFVAAGTGYNNTGDIRIYDANFNLLRILDGHQYETDGVVFTPDGKYLISGGDDGLVKVWDYKRGALIRTLTHGDYLNGGAYVDVDVSPDGQYFSSAGQGYNMTTKIWRTSDGQLLQTLPIDGGDGYNTARFTPDGKYIISGTTQYGFGGLGWHGEIFIWSVPDGHLLKHIIDKEGSPLSGGIITLAVSPLSNNGYYVAFVVNGKLKVYRINLSDAISSANEQSFVTTAIHSGAYPNPFKTSTTIEYTVPLKQFVNITVFDAQGRPVAIPVNAEKDAGTYKVTFDAAQLPGGIYFYRITTKNYSEVKKIILNK